MKVIVDGHGGDKGVIEVLKATRMALEEFGYEMAIVGKESEIKEEASKNEISLQGVEVIDAPEIISMEDAPTEIMKSKNNSSMARGLQIVAANEGDAFVSAGNSGALAVGATLIVKRISGVKRCAFAPIIPKNNGFFMLIDSGANIECRPEMLRQFGVMGYIYMKNVMVVKDPKVGLVNIGTERCKGGELLFETYELLENSGINFIGNIEARDIPSGVADVVVADGFTGNVILKLYEGMANEIFGKFKEILNKNIKNKLAAALISSDLLKMKSEMDYTEYGGAPLMGISKPVFKAHGNSDAKTLKNAIRLAGEYAKRNVVKLISDAIKDNNYAKKANE